MFNLKSDLGFRRRIGLAVTLFPVLAQAAVVRMFGVNSLIADELSDVPFIHVVRDHGNWPHLLFRQLNEHRMVARKFLLAILSGWTDWNVLAEMYFSACLAGLIVWGLWLVFRNSTGRDLLAFSPQAWIVCGLGQWFNMTTGIQMAFYFTVLGWVWALYFLTRPSAGDLALAVFFGLVASFSTLNGALIWPAGSLLLVLSKMLRRRVIGWLAAAIGSTAAYFWRFESPGAPYPLPAALSHPVATLIFFLRVVGAPLAAGNARLALAFGALLVVSTIALLLRRPRLDSGAAALLVLGFGSAAMIGAGRMVFGPNMALQSSYITFSGFALVGLVTILAANPFPLPARAIVGVAALGFAATELQGLRQLEIARSLRVREKFVLQTYRSRTDDQLNGLFVDVEDLRGKISYLDRERLSVFRDPVDVLYLERWREGRAARKILPESPVRQTLISPVANLRDVSIGFAPNRRATSCHVTVSLWTQAERIAMRTVPCRELLLNHRIVLDVRPVVRSASGKSFELRIESPDSAPDDSVTVWMFPSNIMGVLTQPGNSETEGRSLGIELNVHGKIPILGGRE